MAIYFLFDILEQKKAINQDLLKYTEQKESIQENQWSFRHILKTKNKVVLPFE